MWALLTSLVLTMGNTKQDSTTNPEFATRLNEVYRHSVPTVSADELKEWMKQGVVLLDTREEDEYDVSHLKHARQVGHIWFDMRKVYQIPKTDTIVIYCAIGNRSERIGEKLQKAGYQHVYHLFGGIYEWVNQRNPVYNRNGVQTTEVHVYEKSWSRWLNNAAPVY